MKNEKKILWMDFDFTNGVDFVFMINTCDCIWPYCSEKKVKMCRFNTIINFNNFEVNISLFQMCGLLLRQWWLWKKEGRAISFVLQNENSIVLQGYQNWKSRTHGKPIYQRLAWVIDIGATENKNERKRQQISLKEYLQEA